MKIELPKKQVNAVLVALDHEIDSIFEAGERPDWQFFPEVASMLIAYYTLRSKFDKEDDNE